MQTKHQPRLSWYHDFTALYHRTECPIPKYNRNNFFSLLIPSFPVVGGEPHAFWSYIALNRCLQSRRSLQFQKWKQFCKDLYNIQTSDFHCSDFLVLQILFCVFHNLSSFPLACRILSCFRDGILQFSTPWPEPGQILILDSDDWCTW